MKTQLLNLLIRVALAAAKAAIAALFAETSKAAEGTEGPNLSKIADAQDSITMAQFAHRAATVKRA